MESQQSQSDTAVKDIRFDDRVVVITGAGGGLGRIYALEFARRGAWVVVNDAGGARDGSGGGDRNPADAVVEEIRGSAGRAVACYDSVATPEGGEAIIRAAVDAFGRVDVLINNAGILRDRSFKKMTPDEWNAVRSVHLDGAFHVTRPAFAHMCDRGYGRIVFTTSAAGLYGNFGQSNYSAAKLGLVGLMNTLKLEASKFDITVNTVAPVAMTRLTEDIFPGDLGSKLKPESVAPLVLYLCSEQCTDTGMVFNVGMGMINRAAIVTGPAVLIGDRESPPSPEDIRDRRDDIISLDRASEYSNAMNAINAMLYTPRTDNG